MIVSMLLPKVKAVQLGKIVLILVSVGLVGFTLYKVVQLTYEKYEVAWH